MGDRLQELKASINLAYQYAEWHCAPELRPDLEYGKAVAKAAPKMLDLIKRLRTAFYVDGTSKALRPVMAEAKAIVAEAEGKA